MKASVLNKHEMASLRAAHKKFHIIVRNEGEQVNTPRMNALLRIMPTCGFSAFMQGFASCLDEHGTPYKINRMASAADDCVIAS